MRLRRRFYLVLQDNGRSSPVWIDCLPSPASTLRKRCRVDWLRLIAWSAMACYALGFWLAVIFAIAHLLRQP